MHRWIIFVINLFYLYPDWPTLQATRHREKRSNTLSHLLQYTEKGLYCRQADVYIDPHRTVSRAVITHAHSDHARRGHKYYLAHHTSGPILRLRLGKNINLETVEYNQPVVINGVRISLHPAGHVVGSAQVRLEYGGEVWVVSGDYKTEPDGISQAFEPVRCHTFITESTFGLPIFQWQPQAQIFEEINAWWRRNQAAGKISLMMGYSLGKSQRLLHNIDYGIGKVFVHDTIWNVNAAIRQAGIALPEAIKVDRKPNREVYSGGLIIGPMSVFRSDWSIRLQPAVTATASGWMALRKMQRSRTTEYGFVLSDHADWPGLNAAIEATGATRVIVTHGYESALARHLTEKGCEAYEAHRFFRTGLLREAMPAEGTEWDE